MLIFWGGVGGGWGISDYNSEVVNKLVIFLNIKRISSLIRMNFTFLALCIVMQYNDTI